MFKNIIFSVMSIALLCMANVNASASIVVKGNERIAKETIITYSKLDKIESVDDTEIDTAIKQLYATTFFTNVKIEKSAQTIVITVIENPTVRKVAFEGNSGIADDHLKKIIKLGSKDVYSLHKLNIDISAITMMYQKQGYYSTFVEPKIIQQPHNKVDIVYEIKEGAKAKIKKIHFIGNEAMPSSQLKEVIMSREHAFYRFFSSADMFDNDKLMMDQELLQRHYQTYGYFDFDIKSVSSELNSIRNGFIITFLIDEGMKYHCKDAIVVTQLKSLPEDFLAKTIEPLKNKILNIEKIEEVEAVISRHLNSNGYAFADVSHDIIKDRDNKTAVVRFIIAEGNKVYINKINIIDNTRTMDHVIRRYIQVSEGDPYSAPKLERSKGQILNLGYFSLVEFKNKRTELADRIDIDVNVKETSTGSVYFSIGYNARYGMQGGVTLTENNFLGKGHGIELGLQKSSKFGAVNFGFTESNFMNRPIDAGFDLYASKTQERTGKKDAQHTEYINKEIGSGVRMGYRLTDEITHGLRYNIKHTTLKDRGTNPSLATRDFDGSANTSTIGQTLSFNYLDNIIRPTSGIRIQLMQDFAGVGGKISYLKHKAIVSGYKALYKQDIILSLTLQAGNIRGMRGQKVNLINNFYLDQDYIRGFEPDGISPRERSTNDAIGGKNFGSANLEISFPLGLPEEVGINGVAFVDAATLYSYDLGKKILTADIIQSRSWRSSCGLGIVWKSPLGMVKLDYGIPIKKKTFDKVERIRISLGGAF